MVKFWHDAESKTHGRRIEGTAGPHRECGWGAAGGVYAGLGRGPTLVAGEIGEASGGGAPGCGGESLGDAGGEVAQGAVDWRAYRFGAQWRMAGWVFEYGGRGG